VFFRRRDEHGNLIRTAGLPPGVEVDGRGMRMLRGKTSFETMYKDVCKRRGMEAEKLTIGDGLRYGI
jgi:hypothetical protein